MEQTAAPHVRISAKRHREDSEGANSASRRRDGLSSGPSIQGSQQLQPTTVMSWGCQATIGGRPYMEDTYIAGHLLTGCGDDSVPSHLFAVFDGHGGPSVSEYLAGKAVSYITEAMSRQSSEAAALEHAFVALHADLPSVGRETEMEGSTAVAILLNDRRIICANCGDSRAVLSRCGKAIALSDDHKPDRDDEEARIVQAGGRVLFNNGARVMGVLGMSRAIGDKFLNKYGVIPDPEVQIVDRSPQDEFLIIASDGLWGAVSNEEAVDIARRCLQRASSQGAGRAAASRIAAKVLMRAAMHRGSRDNVTVIVVDLEAPLSAPGSPNAVEDSGVSTPTEPLTPPQSPNVLFDSALQQQRQLVQGLLQPEQFVKQEPADVSSGGSVPMLSYQGPSSMRQVCNGLKVVTRSDGQVAVRPVVAPPPVPLPQLVNSSMQQQRVVSLPATTVPLTQVAPVQVSHQQPANVSDAPLAEIMKQHQQLCQMVWQYNQRQQLQRQQEEYCRISQQTAGQGASRILAPEQSGMGQLLSAEHIIVAVHPPRVNTAVSV